MPATPEPREIADKPLPDRNREFEIILPFTEDLSILFVERAPKSIEDHTDLGRSARRGKNLSFRREIGGKWHGFAGGRLTDRA